MKNLSLNTSITQRLSNIFKQIASLYHIEMVFLYGSCACGKAQGLNFRWQAITAFSDTRPLISKLTTKILEREKTTK